MYFCLAKDGDYFTILDTSDGVKEKFSLEDINGYLNQGVEIYGVTLESLSLGNVTEVLVDFPSRDVKTGQVFNGYFFESYNEESYNRFHNRYLYSVISFKDCNVMDILGYLQAINNSVFKKILSCIPKSELGYTVIDSFSNGVFNVRELPLGKEYGFSYSDVCTSLLYENLRVEGFSEITKEYITIFDKTYTLEDSIKYNLDDVSLGSTFFCSQVACDDACVDNISITTGGVSAFIEKFGDKKLSKVKFPMVSLLDYYTSEPFYSSTLCDLIDAISDSAGNNYLRREGEKFIFDNFELDFNKAKLIYEIFKLSNEKFYNDVSQYMMFNKARQKLLTGKDDSDGTYKEFRVNDDYYAGRGKPFNSVTPYLTKDPKYSALETKFGGILTSTYIRPTEVRLQNEIEGIFTVRITHVASFYYRIGRSGMTIMLTDPKAQARRIWYSSFADYIEEYRDDLGYYYNRPNIIPLFVHNIVEHEDGVEVNIVVAVNTNYCMSFVPMNNDTGKRFCKELANRASWGSTILVVPLLLTGTRHYYRGDYVIFDMLFQELAISKSVYNNLIAEVDEFNDLICIDNCSPTSSAKQCNCSIGENDSKNVKEYKKHVMHAMTKFNIDMELKDYFV